MARERGVWLALLSIAGGVVSATGAHEMSAAPAWARVTIFLGLLIGGAAFGLYIGLNFDLWTKSKCPENRKRRQL
jgi:hypothetical protein